MRIFRSRTGLVLDYLELRGPERKSFGEASLRPGDQHPNGVDLLLLDNKRALSFSGTLNARSEHGQQSRPVISEVERMAARVGRGVVCLRRDWPALLRALPGLGRVKALMRNTAAAMEAETSCRELESARVQCGFVNDAINLHFYVDHWAHAFAVSVHDAAGGPRKRSLHFFGNDGAPIHSLLLTAHSSVGAFESIVENFIAPRQDRGNMDVRRQERCQPAIVAPFGSEVFGWRVSPGALRRLLHSVCSACLPMVIQIGNAGCRYLFRGTLRMADAFGDRLKAIRPGLELQFSKAGLAGAWFISRPASGEAGPSLEIYDAQGQSVATLASSHCGSKRDEEYWRRALTRLAVEGTKTLRTRDVRNWKDLDLVSALP